MITRLGKFQRADEQRQIVPINRAEIAHSHFLEEDRAAIATAPIRISRVAGLLQSNAGNGALETSLGLVREFQRQFALGSRRTKVSKSFASLL